MFASFLTPFFHCVIKFDSHLHAMLALLILFHFQNKKMKRASVAISHYCQICKKGTNSHSQLLLHQQVNI